MNKRQELIDFAETLGAGHVFTFNKCGYVMDTDENFWELDHIYWRQIGDGWMERLGRVENNAVRLFQVPYTAWGDYCGSDVERSNYRSILRDLCDDTAGIVTCSGNLGSTCLMVAVDYVSNSAAELILKASQSLMDYPLYDENDWSECLMETREEAWEIYGREDFRSALAEHFGEAWETVCDDLSDKQLGELYYQALCDGGYDDEVEAIGSVIYHFDTVVPTIDANTLRAAWVESKAKAS